MSGFMSWALPKDEDKEVQKDERFQLNFCPFCANEKLGFVRGTGGDYTYCGECKSQWSAIPEHSPILLMGLPGYLNSFRLARAEKEWEEEKRRHKELKKEKLAEIAELKGKVK